MSRFSIVPLLTLLAALSAPAHPALAQAPTQSHASIRAAVKRFLLHRTASPGAQVRVQVDPLDPRLRLTRCSVTLETFLPPSAPDAGRVTTGVRCTGDHPWSLYVPARVQWLDEVLVARSDLPRGAPLDAADVQLERRDLARLPRGYYLAVGRVAGKRAKRNIRRGTVLNPGMLTTPPAIRRGSEVNIVASVTGIEVRMRGKALNQGAVGERIRVQNLSSGRELEARVVSAGTVRVDI